jgi:hypothetical protein
MVVVACSSSKSADGPAPVVTKEIARQEIGPAGGTVAGGAVTIEIPPGALTETKPIVISEIVSGGGALPDETQATGARYAFSPDDVEFLKPVTVKVAVDASKSDGTGAVVLFRAASGTNDWTPLGADESSASTLVGKTTHFSYWVPTKAAEKRCFIGKCGPIPPPRKPDGTPQGPEVLPGMNCKVPEQGPGVRCVGRGPDFGLPYECFCDGSDKILGTSQRLPPDTFITAMAAQCKGVCPFESTCDLQLVFNPGDTTDTWTTSTGRAPTLSCSQKAGATTMCTCAGGAAFAVPSVTRMPKSEDLFATWASNCKGDCNAAIPEGGAVCPGTIAYPNDGGAGCVEETAGTCRDNNFYTTECPQVMANAQPCSCKVNGVETKVVTSTCLSVWQQCGFPKRQGE